MEALVVRMAPCKSLAATHKLVGASGTESVHQAVALAEESLGTSSSLVAELEVGEIAEWATTASAGPMSLAGEVG
jgi:hypothetical protein